MTEWFGESKYINSEVPEIQRDFVPKNDSVNHPSHYTQGGIECIDAIRAALTDEEFRGFCKGNALKYLYRERHKGGDESLEKAMWYIKRARDESE